MKQKLNADLASVNESLYDEMFIQKLENRLETDPLAVGGLVDLVNSSDDAASLWCWSYENVCSGEAELNIN